MKTANWLALGVVLVLSVGLCQAAGYKVQEERLGLWPVAAERSGEIYSRDGLHDAVVVTREGKARVWLDGVEGPLYDLILPGSLVFSPDGRLTYLAQQGTSAAVVVDGVPGPLYAGVSAPFYSPDGKRMAYLAGKGRQRLVVDGVAGPEYDGIGTTVFSRDGQRVAYGAKQGAKSLLVVDGVPGPTFDSLADPMFSPDGKRVAYIVQAGVAWRVVVDGFAGPQNDGVTGLVFSPNGMRVAYVEQLGPSTGWWWTGWSGRSVTAPAIRSLARMGSAWCTARSRARSRWW